MMSSPGRRRLAALVPYMVLVAGLVLTALAGGLVRRATNAREKLRFETEVQHAGENIQDRLDLYISLLRATAGLYSAAPQTDASSFHRYIRRLWLQRNYAGVQGIGYSVKLNPGEADAFIRRMRREGMPAFGLWQSGPTAEDHAIAYLEPMDERNRQALGYNMFSDPIRRAAMERARDSGLPTASGSVQLVQEFASDPRPQHGFLIYVPVYRVPLDGKSSVAARRAALVGFAYSPFRMTDMMQGIFQTGSPNPFIRFDIYDSAVETPDHLLYRSGAPGRGHPRFRKTVSVDAGGRKWTAVFASERGFDQGAGRGVVPSTFLAGAVFSILVFGVLLFQMRSRETAERAAVALRKSIAAREAAEAQVREGEAQLRQLYEEAKAARADAEQANRLKDDFLATVSHELRTPLNAIVGYSQLLSMGGRTEEQTRRALQAIERNVKAQAQLIDDLLDVSRIVSGKLRLELLPVDPAVVVRHATEALAPDAATKEIALDLEAPLGIATVQADEGRLQQVVWNLLSNAIKFTPRGGRIVVRLRVDAECAEIIVSDTGRGIAPDALEHIFDRFRQADSSTTRRYGGLGLGLSIVRELVQMQGGVVSAESDGEDMGSTFTVSLPLVAGVSPPAPAVGSARFDAGALAGVDILTVDDDEDARTLVREILEDAGATVRTASSAAEAMQALRHRAPDVLVSDIGMPGEDGYALIRRVRALPAADARNVPAIAVTAFTRAGDRQMALDAGFQHHVPKPVDPRALIALIADLRPGRAASNAPAGDG